MSRGVGREWRPLLPEGRRCVLASGSRRAGGAVSLGGEGSRVMGAEGFPHPRKTGARAPKLAGVARHSMRVGRKLRDARAEARREQVEYVPIILHDDETVLRHRVVVVGGQRTRHRCCAGLERTARFRVRSGEERGHGGEEGGRGGGEERGWCVVEAIGPAPQSVSPSRSLREVCCGRSREGGDSLRSVCSQCIT